MEGDFKINFRRLNHVTMAAPADGHERARAFYGGVLGLQELQRPPQLSAVYDIVWFGCADFQIHIDFNPPWIEVAQNRHFSVEVENVEEVRKYLDSKGVVTRDAVKVPGRHWFYFLDPFGNTLEFLELK